ncbi:myb-binding 1A [Pelobates cultripes]|uniref:Myb-binding 1A n=1 Tax=Pelobates cultripes TaxID=61616 RepID=A0AAD1VKL0_PELCU|nr:myb-binding 1A [Pelobates cultripes]
MAVESSPDMDTAQHAVQTPSKKSPNFTIRGVQSNREFLDFFWDIAKPDQEIRLTATENLIQYLKSSTKEDELKYTFKRLVEGLAATRELARPGFSLALAQVLQCFEDIPLSTVLEHILEKHNPEKVKKKSVRNAAFGSFFGVLALFQSGRLIKDHDVLLRCVQLLQRLSLYREHLKDLPNKTLVDILTEIPESTFEEVLFRELQSDLTSAFSTPEQLHLLLVGMQMFPAVLKPKKLKRLLGSSTITTVENIPKLVEMLKMAARSVKKERSLPDVALDLMRMSVKEQAFELFWKEVVENSLLKDQSGPCTYMCYRLLGASLPLLDLSQLQIVLRSEVMLHYGAHVVSTQPADRFKFSPEMESYMDAYLAECTDPEKQAAVMIGFSLLTNQGYPVVPSVWKVIRHMQPAALQSYIDWLKNMFIQADLSSCMDFSTKRQKEKQEQQISTDYFVFRLRKWIIPRLCSIAENNLVKRSEEQVRDIARFIFFHAFFEAKMPVSNIPETKSTLSVPLEDNLRALVADAFFSLLFHLNCMPVMGDSPAAAPAKQRQATGVTADGVLWIEYMIQYANTLLSRGKLVKAVTPFTEEQKASWDRMLQHVESLKKKAKKSVTMESSSYQQLLLLVGIHLFKTPEESMEILSDIKACLEKAQNKKAKKKTKKDEDDQEPEWVEVMVEILLSLFSQPSRLFRLVARNVFKNICPYVTKNALQLILNVLDAEDDDSEDGAIVVTEEKGQKKSTENKEDEQDSGSDDESEDDEDEDDDDDNSGDEDPNETVNDDFRIQLMKIMQDSTALEGQDSDDDLDDDAMMALDKNLSALFAEQKKRIQAKKDEKERIRKEKILRKDFKTKVLDLVDVFVKKQPESPLVFNIIEPLISTITQSMNSESSNQQERDYLQKSAAIFMNDLCKSKKYCRDVSELKEELHAMMERLLNGACKQNDSSVGLYYFSASLYLFKVLKNSTKGQPESDDTKTLSQGEYFGCLDLPRVTELYQESLKSFMSKRKTSLTAAMFMDLFHRYPFMCKPMLTIILTSIKDGARQHQQSQACALLLKALQTADLKKNMSPSEWQDLLKEAINQVIQTLEAMTEIKVKVDQEKLIKCFELLNFLIKTVTQQKLEVNLTELHPVLQSVSQNKGFGTSIRERDMYWNVMKLIGVVRPKETKRKAVEEVVESNNPPKKKKGFLPETKKRNARKKATTGEPMPSAAETKIEISEDQSKVSSSKKRKKRRNKKKILQSGATLENSAVLPPIKKAKPNGEAVAPKADKTKKKKAKNKNAN